MIGITIFESPQFGQVRTMMGEKGEAWFCLKDVCLALELTLSKVVQRLDDDVLSKYPISPIETHHGAIESCTTIVMGKGQEYFVNGFLYGRFKSERSCKSNTMKQLTTNN